MSDSKLKNEAKARFDKDTATHEMTVHLSHGLHRHLTFKRPGSSVYHFHITTWPGYLCISGDMECFVFSRLPDMFEFFRGSHINPSYWAEKLQADDKHSGHRAFSQALYEAALKSDFEGWSFDSDDDRKSAWEAIADEFDGILHAESTEHAIRQAMEWECPVSKQRFTDFSEHEIEDFTFQFLWCCYAIQWAIARFDEAAPVDKQPILFRKLAHACFNDDEIDPGSLQRWLVDAGVLIRHMQPSACGENCSCAEYTDKDEWPVECFRLAPEYQDAHAPAGS